MELRHLRSFVVLADELHFGRAAARIPLAQPALSHHIKQLERELGARLFERGSGLVRLTVAGEHLLPHARATLWHAQHAVSAVREQVSGVTGHLHLGIFANGAAELTVPVVNAFRAARPGVRISVVELDVLHQTSELVEHRVDVAFVRPPLGDGRVTIVPLATEPRVAVLASTHPLGAATSLMVDDILGEQVLAAHPDEPRTWTDHWRLTDRRGGRAPVEVGPGDLTTVLETLYALVVRDCVTTAPASMARHYPVNGVSFVPLADAAACEIALAVRVDEHDPLIDVFVATARRTARQLAHLLRSATVVVAETAGPAGQSIADD